jgi:CRISPR-associated endonuclease/helicase Cas3
LGDYAAACWQYPQAALSGVLPQQQPFRHDPQRDVTLAWLSDEEDGEPTPHRVEEVRSGKRGEKLYVPAAELLHHVDVQSAKNVSRWGKFELAALLAEQAEAQELSLEQAGKKFTTVDVPASAQGWHWHPWLGFGKAR